VAGMARPTWSGAISFGLVNVPVKAFTGVRSHTVHFHQLEKDTGARVRYRKVSEKTDKQLDADDIEPGYELSRGRYVVVDPDELDRLRPKSTRAIEIEDFVELTTIDPIYYDTTYWLAPDGEQAAKPYGLLLAAMQDEQRVGVGSVVIRNKQHLAAIRPYDGRLVLTTMRFADEVLEAPDEVSDSDVARPATKERKLARQIVDSMTTDWDPGRYHDTYTEQVQDLIKRKAKGEEITVEEGEEAPADVVDLTEALEASIAAARQGRRRGGEGRSGAGAGPKRGGGQRRRTGAGANRAGGDGRRAASAKGRTRKSA
jgi:DNA end-binding protein Ku